MSEEPVFFNQRERAESFGTVADDYERHRPAFPSALIDDLVALAPRSVLDIGTGTGKVARALAAHGVNVLGVEVDARMASVAKRHGTHVEISKFEDWDDRDRTFDLVVCGDAWHWIDPKRGEEKVARVLERGKTFARFFNSMVLTEDVLRVLLPVYREHASGARLYGTPIEHLLPPDPLLALTNPLFLPGETKRYHWEKIATNDEWISFIGTVSDHVKLGPDKLAALEHAARVALDSIGDTIRIAGTTYASFAKRSLA